MTQLVSELIHTPTLSFRGILIYFLNLKQFPNCNFKMERVQMIFLKTKSVNYSIKSVYYTGLQLKAKGGCMLATISANKQTSKRLSSH